jgi:hypothetical protein
MQKYSGIEKQYPRSGLIFLVNDKRGRTMKKLAIVACMLLLVVGVANAANTITKKAGEYTVAFTTDRNPPVTGKNNVEVAVKDASGRAVTDAKVVIEYSMPAMPGMPAMNYKSTAELKGESYKAEIDPSMTGPWNLAVKITRGGKSETAKFTLDVK